MASNVAINEKIDQPARSSCRVVATLKILGSNVAFAMSHRLANGNESLTRKEPDTNCGPMNCIAFGVSVPYGAPAGERTVVLKAPDGREVSTTFTVTATLNDASCLSSGPSGGAVSGTGRGPQPTSPTSPTSTAIPCSPSNLCASGVCFHGTCRVATPKSCTGTGIDSACGTDGRTCLNNACTYVGGYYQPCGSGVGCDQGSECDAGVNQCVPVGAENTACRMSGAMICDAGLSCVNRSLPSVRGTCKRTGGLGQPCTPVNNQGSSLGGTCQQGTCKSGICSAN